MPGPDLTNITLPLNINGFACSEVAGSGACVVDGNQSTGVRIFHVQYSEAVQFINSFLPSAAIVNNEVVYSRGALMPHFQSLVAVRGKFEGFGAIFPTGPSNSINYPLAQVTIEYVSNESVLNLGESANLLIKRTEQAAIGGEMLELPKNTFKFADLVPVEQAQGMIMPHMDYTVTEENVPREKFNPGLFLSTLGGINTAVLLGSNGIVTLGSALYLGTSMEMTNKISVFGLNGESAVVTTLWKLTHQFKVRRERWDYVYRPGFNQWQQITPSPYPFKDIGAVLQPVP